MIVNLKSEKLKVGMFIDLSDAWMSNPFWKSEFEIKSEKEIKKIIKAGIKSVNVDTNKSKVEVEEPQEKEVKTAEKKAGKPAPQEKESDAVDKKPDTTTPLETKNEAANISTTVKEPDVSTEEKQDKVETEKVKVIYKEEPKIDDKEEATPPAEWNPEKFMPKEMVNAFKDKSLPPNNRAKIVHDYSIEMMKNLLENPTAEVIAASKKGISEIVDVILNEDETSQSLVKIVAHDFYTYTHSVNVGVKSILLAKRLYKSAGKKEMDDLGAGFFLHDLGKVNVDPNILNKPGRLTEEEMQEIRTHPYQSYKILSDTEQLTTEAWVITMQHHERDDGKGYPRKLKGEEIHPHARICCLADIYDALTAERSYKKAKPPIVALKIMYEEMATHFNKDLLQNFIALFRDKK